ncbi:MAG: ubiquinone/menaquinone biosynthesis methyltransferase [Candidatus Desulfovibrio faecigallinarum]|nr:ubiquinone/menaquinone biosynthesis methyltransferase [Candidatus Desulfovibrio faecigallinarum]
MRNTAISAHDQAVSGMFGRIARFYDLLNHVLSLGIDCYWRRVLAKSVLRGATHRFLDLAAGTLDVSFALRKHHPGYEVLALDFCYPMLAHGQKKLVRRKERRIYPVTADGKHLPLPDNSVDSVTIAFGIRNIIPRPEALREMYRVLAPGGRVCILEFGSGRDRIWGGLYNFYLNRVLPGIGRIVSRDQAAYSYLARTIREFPSAFELAREMEEAGFVRVRYEKLTSGIVCLHMGEKRQYD